MRLNHSIYRYFLLGAAICTLTLFAGMPSALAQKDKQLAKIGKDTITQADLDSMADAVPERFRYLYATPEGQKQTLDYIVNVYVLAAQAENEGIANDPRFQTFLNFTKKDLLARLYLEKATKKLPDPTEKEVKDYYDQKGDEFTTAASFHLRHILVKAEDEAQDVLKKLKKGAKFDELATKVSTCPSKTSGGDLGWMPRGRLVKEIEDAAFTMKTGDIAGPVKSKYGYHVLLLEESKPEQKSGFDEVKEYIFDQLKYQKQQELYEKLADSLRKQMKVEVAEGEATPQAQPGTPVGPLGPVSAPKK